MTYKEIDEMIETVDKNGDGKISFSEFRCKVFQTKRISKKQIFSDKLMFQNSYQWLICKEAFVEEKFYQSQI